MSNSTNKTNSSNDTGVKKSAEVCSFSRFKYRIERRNDKLYFLWINGDPCDNYHSMGNYIIMEFKFGLVII